MDDREKRRKQRRDAAINETIRKRFSSFWSVPKETDDSLPAPVEEVLEAHERIEPGEKVEAAPVQPAEAEPQESAAAPAPAESAPPAPVRPVRTKSSEETMVFVIRTNAIRDKKKGGESDE